MAIFGSNRDFSFINRINKELIQDIIDTPVAFYKIKKDEIKTNVYDENTNPRSYYDPVLVFCLIDREIKSFKTEEFGVDYDENTVFAFIKDELMNKNIYVETGDIIEYDGNFYEITPVNENQYFMGKKTSTWFGNKGYGDSLSIICDGHIINREKIENNRNY